MDWNIIVAGVIGFSALIGAGLSIWNFVQSPSKKNAEDLAMFKKAIGDDFATLRRVTGEDIKVLDQTVDDTRGRVATLETQFKQLPDKDSVHRLAISLEQLNTKIAGMAASAEATERTARRVETFLLKQAGVDA